MREKFNESINLNTSNEHKESTYGAKDMHRKHVEDLKKKLSAYKADPFGERNARDISTGKEVDHNIIEGLINSGERGNELLKGFIQTRLIDGTVKFYDPIKKVNLDTGLKKKKNENKVLSSVKQDRQAFGMIISNNIDLEIAFSYPITDLPLSIANIDGTLRTGQKCLLRNHLITESNAEVETSPHNASWIVDTMSIIRTMKPEKTFKDFFRKLMNIVSPPSSFQPKRLELVNDVYKNRSIKSMARLKRGENAQRTHVNSIQQNILKGNDWTKCFKNNDNKNDLLHQISEFLKEVDVRNQLQIPVRINDMFDTIDTVNFIKEICYNGSEIESLVDVRVKIYRSLKTKSSQSLPPDPKSMEQHIRRCNCQLMIWLSCDQANHQCISLDGSGWMVKNEQMQPVWFLGK